MARFFLRSFFIFTLPVVICAQYPNINFEHITIEQGLSYSRISCFLQDQQGFLWIGTQDGLNKFDGYYFTVFRNNPNDSTSISSHRIWSILEDKEGIIWIGTLDGGLNRFDPEKQQFRHYVNDPDNPNTLSQNTVTTISEDTMGFLWIGTLRGGLNKFDKKTEKFIRYQSESDNPHSLNNNSVLATCIDKSNILWVGTWGGGLNKFNQEKEQFVQYKYNPKNSNSISSDVIWSIFVDKMNTLWIGTMDGGLDKFNRDTESFTRYMHDPKDINSISQNNINLVYEDLSGRLWIGTWGGGLDEFDPITEKFKNYHHNPDDPYSLSHNEVKSIYEDNSGIIWIGTNGGGLNKLDFEKEKFAYFRHIPNMNSLSHNDVWPVYCDRSGQIWLGTIGGGLNKFNFEKQLFTSYKYSPDNNNSLSHNSVISILEDHDGMLWIGTINGGLNKFNPVSTKFTRYLFDPEQPTSLSHNFIPSLYEDKSGKLWIGTWGGGLCLYEKEKDCFKRYQHNPNDNNSISDNIVWSICEDRYGAMWIGTESGGLNKYDQEKGIFKHYFHDPGNPKSLSSNAIYSIVEDSRGILWIGTAGFGLNKYDRQFDSFIRFTSENGLANNMINGIVEDDNGYLWISTNKGLSKFDPIKEKFRNYDRNDGLQSNQFNFNGVNKRKTGELLFSGINGFNIFNPALIQDNQNIPPIIITGFQLFNEPVTISENEKANHSNSYTLPKHISNLKKIVLAYYENAFSFEFAALDYHSPQKNKYAYRMEGVDLNWVYTDASRRFATYTNLDPGEYTFRVKGSNNDGVWNEAGTSIKVIITPPWWETNLAYVLYILLFISAGYITWRLQLRRIHLKQQMEMDHFEAEKLREVDQMKSRFFANVSHEFRTPLTLIKGPVKQMLDGKFAGNIKEQYKMILRNSDRLLSLINQILDISKLESGKMKLQVSEMDISDFLKALALSFASLAERKRIKLNTDLKNIRGFVDRDKLEKIVNNLLSNAFKFTPEGGEIVVSLNTPSVSPLMHKGGIEGGLEIVISNTGPGIPTEQQEKIFDRFYQAPFGQVDNQYQKDGQGTGIGLALTRDLVEACRGAISVSSMPNKNTTFTVILPVAGECFKDDEIVDESEAGARRPKTGEPKVKASEPDTKNLTGKKAALKSSDRTPASVVQSPLILIVEDNPDMTRYISSFMESDYRILTAGNGKEGLNKTIDKYPDLIISDVMMPEMDGFEFCKQAKRDERISHIPIILLTAKADMTSKIDGLEFGADDYITKPFEAKELQIRTKNLIEQRRKLREKFSFIMDLKPEDIAASSMDEQLLHRLLAVFEDHMEEPDFSIEKLAIEIGLSRRHLNRKIRALTNLSPTDFIRTLRLHKAARLLKNTSGTVSEIAYKVGFNNLSYFSKSFHRHFGKVPSDFLNS